LLKPLVREDYINSISAYKKNITCIREDPFYDVQIVENVSEVGDEGILEFKNGANLFCEKSKDGTLPKPGETVFLFHKEIGNSIGNSIRGIATVDENRNIKTIYRYQTPLEEINSRFDEAVKYRKKEEESFKVFELEYNDRISKLPDVFQKRFVRFHKNNPTFGQEFGGYELMCCEDAVKLVDKYPTKEELENFSSLEFDLQMEAWPGSTDHSGNSWGFTKHIAQLYVIRPDLVEYEHGAMHGLVGCEDYGCYAAYPDGSIPIKNN
jgi:hypothetical protein